MKSLRLYCKKFSLVLVKNEIFSWNFHFGSPHTLFPEMWLDIFKSRDFLQPQIKESGEHLLTDQYHRTLEHDNHIVLSNSTVWIESLRYSLDRISPLHPSRVAVDRQYHNFARIQQFQGDFGDFTVWFAFFMHRKASIFGISKVNCYNFIWIIKIWCR